MCTQVARVSGSKIPKACSLAAICVEVPYIRFTRYF